MRRAVCAGGDEAGAVVERPGAGVVVGDVEQEGGVGGGGFGLQPVEHGAADALAARLGDQREVDDVPGQSGAVESEAADRHAVRKDHPPLGVGMADRDMAFLACVLLGEQGGEHRGGEGEAGGRAPVAGMGAGDQRGIVRGFGPEHDPIRCHAGVRHLVGAAPIGNGGRRGRIVHALDDPGRFPALGGQDGEGEHAA